MERKVRGLKQVKKKRRRKTRSAPGRKNLQDPGHQQVAVDIKKDKMKS